MRGGEKCVEALCEVFPQATLFALVHVRGAVSNTIERMPIHTSFIQHLPFARREYRKYLPLFPTAVRQFDLSEFDIVITSNHAVAKGAHVPTGALHICYCHTPMRYIWNLYDEYFSKDRANTITRFAMRLTVGYLRNWDLKTASNPHYFIANSKNVQQRIENLYHRSSHIIYPPVDTSFFRLSRRTGEYFLIVSAFVPYKRIGLAIQAFNRTGDHLVIVGDGPDDAYLRKLANRNVEFVGWKPDTELREYYSRCRALMFPGEEDFGIVPVEAMATGKPVIAYAKGGALETVVDSPGLRTGVLFYDQTPEALIDAIQRFKDLEFHAEELRAHALAFDRELYKARMKAFIQEKWLQTRSSPEAQASKYLRGTTR
ncbi:MAG: glycosyltransferase [Ignavibacteriae bacterium]|nr:glycosyltransferase [Ignavibacteriota bacterium]